MACDLRRGGEPEEVVRPVVVVVGGVASEATDRGHLVGQS